MLNFLYSIIIFPIEQIIEIAYSLIYKVFAIPGLSVIGVSLAVTFLSLPLYIIAEKWQETERQTIKNLKPKADKIKQIFKGDEQYMILSTYYRQNNYHPIYSLRNSLNALIQIPFFIAAYHFLSNFSALHGVSFLFLKDLGKPDALLSFGNFSINILPILMTAINCISGIIYTKKLSLRDKLQIYVLALIFLVLLYNSPSCLVLYWTMNNIFSLVKNLFYKLKNPIKILYIIICAFLLLFISYLLFLNNGALKKRIILSSFCFFILLTPIIIKLYIRLQNYFLIPLIEDDKHRCLLFIVLCSVLTILVGFSIPSSVIASSPEEFSFIDTYQSPFPFIFNTLFKSVGLFLFWSLCIYFLFGRKIQCLLTLLFWMITTGALINTFVFQKNFFEISIIFTFDNPMGVLTPSIRSSLLSVFLALIFFTVFILLINYKRIKIINTSLVLLLISLIAFSTSNTFAIQKRYANFAISQKTKQSNILRITPIFHLSKDKQNIIIIMADRAINGFVKPIFDEHPDLYDKFDGFTYFPNTVSFNGYTLMGVPPVWGGYEYTPLEMNRKNSIPLVEKHNEALMVIPKILSKTGYQVTITDPSLANYQENDNRDISIYENKENITALNTIGLYTDLWTLQHDFNGTHSTGKIINRNILWFSFLKISPPFFRKIVYDDGDYWNVMSVYVQQMNKFINNYAVLDFLAELTAYDSEKSSALLITNEATHEPVLLQYPLYIPLPIVTNIGNGIFSYDVHFHVNNALYLRIGDWLDELKKNNVYNNSRIIIVSDHGRDINAMISDTELTIPNERREFYNPVLLFKDFNSTGKLRTDMSFMTNADVPVFALDGVAETINPFTGKSLLENPKKEGAYISTSRLYQVSKHNKTTFNIHANEWLFVHDNIFNPSNWERAEK